MTSGRLAEAVSRQPIVDMSMRAKQLVATLRQGRKIGLDILDEGWWYGYLAGWDAETYFLLVPNKKVEKFLVPKDHILAIELVEERTFREEEFYEEMEKIVRPFRDAMNSQYPKT